MNGSAAVVHETAKHYSLTEHIYSPLGLFMSDMSFRRMDGKLRDRFLESVAKATADTRAHGLAVASEAVEVLKGHGVTVATPDKAAFRARVLPQAAAFVKAHPATAPIVETIRSTSA